ncbi:hypothetical protein NMY22_g13513 [Coprinellus aureogranulatus]|nr:hypothetical protein NMY22_g13513 [Coprinellus aureogranulatus]
MNDNSTSQKQNPLPPAILAHFLRQIEGGHVRTPASKPVPLHYDSETKSLKEFRWPFDVETGRRIPPSMLQEFRRTHHFRGPSCLCAFLDDEDYTEAIIGIVEVAQDDTAGGNGSAMNGQYVAACERQRCGFFLCLEKFYMLEGVRLQACPRRGVYLPTVDDLFPDQSGLHSDYDLQPEEPNCISDLRGFVGAGEPFSGLSQVVNEPTVCIRRRGAQIPQMKPEASRKAQEVLMKSLVEGMSETAFWKNFVQCFVCKTVVLRMGTFSYHKCPLGSEGSHRRLYFTPPHDVSWHRTVLPRRARSNNIRVRLDRMPGDTTQSRPLAPIRSRSRSLTPMDVSPDGHSDSEMQEDNTVLHSYAEA